MLNLFNSDVFSTSVVHTGLFWLCVAWYKLNIWCFRICPLTTENYYIKHCICLWVNKDSLIGSESPLTTSNWLMLSWSMLVVEIGVPVKITLSGSVITTIPHCDSNLAHSNRKPALIYRAYERTRDCSTTAWNRWQYTIFLNLVNIIHYWIWATYCGKKHTTKFLSVAEKASWSEETCENDRQLLDKVGHGLQFCHQ